MTSFWYLIVAVGIVVGLINLGIAYARRKTPMLALIRVGAAIVSFVAVAGILVGKAMGLHPFLVLEREYVLIGAGVFIFFVLFLPSTFERNAAPEAEGQKPRVTMAQRAARPANATVRLRDARSGSGSDEWVN
ncbi:MAG TPA: hypothetical protein VF116_14345 [Ktedonobacterales bacterium]